MTSIIDMTGKKFRRLTVISRIGADRRGNMRWQCRCECGNTKNVLGYNLRCGSAKSCGCLDTDYMKNHVHGDSGTHFYRKWTNMRSRCKNKIDYNRKGIIIDLLWELYENFKADMYNSYKIHVNKYGKKDTTLDRRDNDGPYSLENCRWATYYEQNRNRY